MTVRQLEALIRLSEATARIYLENLSVKSSEIDLSQFQELNREGTTSNGDANDSNRDDDGKKITVSYEKFQRITWAVIVRFKQHKEIVKRLRQQQETMVRPRKNKETVVPVPPGQHEETVMRPGQHKETVMRPGQHKETVMQEGTGLAGMRYRDLMVSKQQQKLLVPSSLHQYR
ncbi:unnamed protein product [Trifolium pratense]|uniref:Uncharacterized protein n=1 Tax=Trifolium pratense TaxID=57577 RepID=A0ACB0J2Q6_TRIPR|nr:unnamed protein product [Trifolium pratense]